jgi:hypothetical protein
MVDPHAPASPPLGTKFAIAVAVIVAAVVALNALTGFQFGNWGDTQQRAEIARSSFDPG